MLRTHTCGELTKANADEEVTVCGWVDRVRDHGKGLFIDLRDRYGRTQVVVGTSTSAEVLETAGNERRQFCFVKNRDVAGVEFDFARRDFFIFLTRRT